MSPTYSSFAVIGAGTVGGPILAALVAQPSAKVILLSRSASTSKSVPANVEVVQVPSYDDVPAVAAALKTHHVEVIVSTLNIAALPSQFHLADAAKQAGVKLFVPSEFGFSTEGASEGLLGAKQKTVDKLQSLGVPYLRIFTGLFIEFVPWAVNYTAEAKKLYVVGKSESAVSVASVADIAGYLAHVLTVQPPAILENKILRIEGDRIQGFRSLGPLFGAQVETVEKLDGEMADFKAFLMSLADQGLATTGHGVKGVPDEEASKSGNALWAGHRWETIRGFYDL